MASGPVALSNSDIAAFLADVPNAASDIESHRIASTGDPTQDWSFDGNIPRYGRAYQWNPSGGGNVRWILVSLDANYVWHFLDVSAMPQYQSLVANANNPAYVSPPGNVYLDTFNELQNAAAGPLSAAAALPQNIMNSISDSLTSFVQGLNNQATQLEYMLLLIVIAAIVVVAIAVFRVKSFKVPGLDIAGK